MTMALNMSDKMNTSDCVTYIGKTNRHLVVRAEEHLRYEKDLPKSEIKTHLKGCHICRESNINNFKIIKKCMSDMRLKSMRLCS